MERWRSRTETAWVLRRRPYGETDALMELYGRQLGRFLARAPAARKPGSRKGGHLELFGEVRVSLAQGRHWWVLTQAELQTWFPRLRTSPQAYVAASELAELVLRLVPEGERLPGLYELLGRAFRRIGQDETGARWAPRIAAWHLMRLAGFAPQWSTCVHCGRQLVPGRPKYLDIREGGIRCDACGQGGLPRLSDRAWAVLLHWSRIPFDRAADHPPEDDLYEELVRLEQQYIRYWVERPLHSWRVGRQLGK